jgi:hypothetical protein
VAKPAAIVITSEPVVRGPQQRHHGELGGDDLRGPETPRAGGGHQIRHGQYHTRAGKESGLGQKAPPGIDGSMRVR